MAIRRLSRYPRLSQRQLYSIDTLAYHAQEVNNLALHNIRHRSPGYCIDAAISQMAQPDHAADVTTTPGSSPPTTQKKDLLINDLSQSPASQRKMRNGSVTPGISWMCTQEEIHQHQVSDATTVPHHQGKVCTIRSAYAVPLQPACPDPAGAATASGTASIIDGAHLRSMNRCCSREDAGVESIEDTQGLTGGRGHRPCRLPIRPMIADHITSAYDQTIGTMILPGSDGIRRQITHGAGKNRYFVQVPDAGFWHTAELRSDLCGMQYADSHGKQYASQVDALADGLIRKLWYGRRHRLWRGLNQSTAGTAINADLTGAVDHVRKVAVPSVRRPIIRSGRVNRPVRIRHFNEQPLCTLDCTPGHMTATACSARQGGTVDMLATDIQES